MPTLQKNDSLNDNISHKINMYHLAIDLYFLELLHQLGIHKSLQQNAVMCLMPQAIFKATDSIWQINHIFPEHHNSDVLHK